MATPAHLQTPAQPLNHIAVRLYYKCSTRQFHVYVNPALRYTGIHVPKDQLSDPPPGTLDLRLDAIR